jgi:hypothetical protein
MDDATPTVSPAAATPGVASCVCARTTAGGATTAPKAGSLWTLLPGSQLVGGLLTARDDFVLRVELPIVTDVSRSVRLALPNLRHALAIRGVASRGGSFDVPNVWLGPTNRRLRSLSGSLPLAIVPFQERRVRLELPSRRLQSPKASLRVTIVAFGFPNVRPELGTRPLRFPSVRLDSPIVRMGSRCAWLRSLILPLVSPNRRLATSSAGLDSAFITLVLRSERLDLLTGRVQSQIVRQRTTNRSLRKT